MELPLGTKAIPLSVCFPAVLGLVVGLGLLNRWQDFTPAAARFTGVYRLKLALLQNTVGLLSLLPVATGPGGRSLLWNSLFILGLTQVCVVGFGDLYWLPVGLLVMLNLAIEMSPAAVGATYSEYQNGAYHPVVSTMVFSAGSVIYSLRGMRRSPIESEES
ncbi:hypothetical protein ACFYL6_20605 [Micromonospora sp. NPDC007208]|uniref:hypothetical protein n=1 Tax=Micromonospora sp. NPDC007208 TaxID=3364236 RepID=UPI0036C6D577